VDGLPGDHACERLLVKRCMTPFQWDTVLTQHLQQKIQETETSLVVVSPYDRLFSTDEISDWEAEDYVRYSTRHLRNLSRRHRVPIVLCVDMARWWKARPVLAQTTYDAADRRFTVQAVAGRWRIVPEAGPALDPMLAKRVTLLDFLEPGLQGPVPVLPRTR
jgi:hypothetical protein